jgi:hypothetical protein
MKKSIQILILMLLGAHMTWAQQVVKGTVTDENGVPLPGATVIELGTQNGVSSDFDGNFNINVGQDSNLEFSYVGYKSQLIKVAGQN